jgi:uncharacterized protein
VSAAGDSRSQAATRIVLRPLANPLPLGFLALAAATLLLSGLQLGWLEPSDGRAVALILLAFVFPLQLLASVLAYLARDVVAATGMGILSGTWLSIALVMLDSPPGATSEALGLFLLCAGAAMWVPASTAAAAKLVPGLVLGTAGLRFVLTGAYQLSGSPTWEDVAAIVGLLLCALGFYTALAMALEDARHRTVLPVGRREQGRRALAGDLPTGGERLGREAGVREQL